MSNELHMWCDIAQICLNGHIINCSSESHPEYNRKFCNKCGAATITKCPHCEADISGCINPGGAGLLLPIKQPPRYCSNCGSAYPWAESGSRKMFARTVEGGSVGIRGIFRYRTLKKPIEYPKQILEVLYKHYDETGKLKMELETLRERSNVPDPNLYDALRIVAEKGWIEPGIEGQPYFTYVASNGSHYIITLSAEGVSAGEEAVQPRRQKVWNWLKKYYWIIIIGIVIPVLVAVIERCG